MNIGANFGNVKTEPPQNLERLVNMFTTLHDNHQLYERIPCNSICNVEILHSSIFLFLLLILYLKPFLRFVLLISIRQRQWRLQWRLLKV